MKANLTLLLLAIATLPACTSSGRMSNVTNDDVYYMPDRSANSLTSAVISDADPAPAAHTADNVPLSNYERYLQEKEQAAAAQPVPPAVSTVYATPAATKTSAATPELHYSDDGQITYSDGTYIPPSETASKVIVNNYYYDDPDDYWYDDPWFNGRYIYRRPYYYTSWRYTHPYHGLRIAYSTRHGWRIGWEWDYGWYDPWYYDPWYYDPWYYDDLFYYRHFHHPGPVFIHTALHNGRTHDFGPVSRRDGSLESVSRRVRMADNPTTAVSRNSNATPERTRNQAAGATTRQAVLDQRGSTVARTEPTRTATADPAATRTPQTTNPQTTDPQPPASVSAARKEAVTNRASATRSSAETRAAGNTAGTRATGNTATRAEAASRAAATRSANTRAAQSSNSTSSTPASTRSTRNTSASTATRSASSSAATRSAGSSFSSGSSFSGGASAPRSSGASSRR